MSAQWAVVVSSAGTCPTDQRGLLNGGENSSEEGGRGGVSCIRLVVVVGSFHPVLEVFSNSATLNTQGP